MGKRDTGIPVRILLYPLSLLLILEKMLDMPLVCKTPMKAELLLLGNERLDMFPFNTMLCNLNNIYNHKQICHNL